MRVCVKHVAVRGKEGHFSLTLSRTHTSLCVEGECRGDGVAGVVFNFLLSISFIIYSMGAGGCRGVQGRGGLGFRVQGGGGISWMLTCKGFG